MGNEMKRHDDRSARRRVALAIGLVVAYVLTSRAGEASAQPVSGTISEAPPAPNFAAAADAQYDKNNPATGGGSDPSLLTRTVVDSANGVLLETNQLGAQGLSHCPGTASGHYVPRDGGVDWVAFDVNTYKQVAYGCNLPAINGQTANFSLYDPNVAVVAPQLGAVLVPCRRCEDIPAIGNTAPSVIAVISERTLKTVSWLCAAQGNDPTWTGPAQCTTPEGSNPGNAPYRYLHDISWYGPTDDILAVTDNFPAPNYPNNADPSLVDGPAGVAVTDYHVSQDAQGGLSFTLRWTVYLSPPLCTRSLTDFYDYTAAAYRSEKPGENNLFVPCQGRVLGYPNASPDPHTAIVKVPLQSGCACPSNNALPLPLAVNNPNGDARATIAPIDGQALIFDAAAERGYLLPPTSTEGFTISVYDGSGAGAGAFIGRINGASGGGLSFGLDGTTGRLYLDDALSTGLMVVDGRRTPVQPGRPFPSLGRSPYGVAVNKLASIAPADATHPYARIFESLVTDFNPNLGGVGRSSMKHLTVIADAIPASQDPPAAQIDQNTVNGPVPPGATVSTATYTAHTAGYGFHSDLVGGYGGIPLNNVSGFDRAPQPPYGTKTIDTAAAVVEDGTMRDGVAHGAATAFADVNGNATQVYGACSDMFSPQGCSPVSCANPVVDPSSPAHDPCGAAIAALSSGTPPMSTKQAWPYPQAACSQSGPGDKNQSHQDVSGVEYTPEHSTAASATQSAVPSSDQSGARASVDCRDLHVTTSAQYECAGGTLPVVPSGVPSSVTPPDFSPSGCDGGKQGQVTILGGLTTTQVQPPTATVPQTYVTVTANAYGIHIALPDGTQMDIKQAQQIATAWAGGLPGTAHTTRQVVVSGVVTTKPGQKPDVLCAGSCTGSSTLLDALNGLDPAHLYITFPSPNDQFGREKDGVSPLGSPGGYLATVQADPAQQGGDERWNAMTGFGGTEKALLPAMRIVVYNSGDAEVSREVLDLAGVEADASLGVQVSGDNQDINTPTIEVTQGMIDAGVPTGSFNSGNGGSMGMPGQPKPIVYHTGLQGVIERALDGIRWLLRSPFGGIQMAAFLVMLGLPVMLLRRRWLSGPRV
jgi:hypothetical protein